jgi:hypothetical protein
MPLDDKLRDSIREGCCKLMLVLNDLLVSGQTVTGMFDYTNQLGKVWEKALKLNGKDLQDLETELKGISKQLRRYGPETLLTAEHEEILKLGPNCPTHRVRMKWTKPETVINVPTSLLDDPMICLFRRTKPKCDIVCFRGKFHSLDNDGNLGPMLPPTPGV